MADGCLFFCSQSPLYLSPSLFVSSFLYFSLGNLSLSISLCRSLSLLPSLSLSASLSLHVFPFFTLSSHTPLAPCVFISPSISYLISLSPYLSPSLSISLAFLSLSVCLSPSLSLAPLSLSFSLSLHLSFRLSLSLLLTPLSVVSVHPDLSHLVHQLSHT